MNIIWENLSNSYEISTSCGRPLNNLHFFIAYWFSKQKEGTFCSISNRKCLLSLSISYSFLLLASISLKIHCENRYSTLYRIWNAQISPDSINHEWLLIIDP